jgi:dihydrolipoamide dehydrogenase
MRALDLGKHVCIVEGVKSAEPASCGGPWLRRPCGNWPRISPSRLETLRGYRASGLRMDYQAMRDSVLQAVREKQYQMLSQIESFSPRRWPGPGSLTLKKGWGAFVSDHSVAIEYPDGQQEEIQADYFVIATGSRPRAFPGIVTDGERVVDSDTILNLKAFPKRLVIVGAGVIGCEYATIFSNFGQTQVYLGGLRGAHHPV